MDASDVTDAKVGRAVQIAVLMARIDAPLIRSVPGGVLKNLVKDRVKELRELGALTEDEANALSARVDGVTESTAAPLPVFGNDGNPSLAGVISGQLPDGNASSTDSATGAYVAAMAGLGAGIVGFAVCGTGCAVMAAVEAGALTASIDHP